MVKKTHRSTDTTDADTDAGMGAESASGWKSHAQFSGSIKESAQQIWLAGLGAFAKAQEEGGKVFEALVKEGTSIQRKTQSAAEDKITEATSRMANMATDISSKASGQWDKLETIFEQRVSKALSKLGVPSAKDIEALTERIDELNRNMAKLNAKHAGAGRRAAKQPANAATKPNAKPATKPSVRRAPARKSA